ncbi:MAG: spermidine/putrescine ABC transporter substrate-binding protein [Chloroflexi bacterium]|nr:spermidine/putrescine ABC transporter substrate-binding protein [Chloroflexota bacterium]
MPEPLLSRPVTRRAVLVGGSLAGFAAFLAACGTSGTSNTPSEPAASSGPTPTAAPPTPKPTPSAELNFANWPLYIDTDDNDPTKHKTLEDFKAEYGTTVKYSEVINDNDEFFGTIKAPLQAGQDTGWDLIVLTDWMAGRLVRLQWLEKFDLGNVPNYVNNLQDGFKAPDWDPTNEYHAPWQAGMTGLGYDSAVTGELTSVNAFWDAKWKGKMTYLTEMRDTVGFALIKLGYSRQTFTLDQFDQAIAELRKAVDAKLVRAFTGNEYAESLVSGDVVLAMAWSGDIIQKQADKETLVFRIPDEGGNLWYDNMLIPKGAAHKYTAELMIDFVYRPVIAAQIEAWVNYICPVKGAKEELAKTAPDLANSELIFPSAATYAKVTGFRSTTEAEETHMNDAFAALIGA